MMDWYNAALIYTQLDMQAWMLYVVLSTAPNIPAFFCKGTKPSTVRGNVLQDIYECYVHDDGDEKSSSSTSMFK